MTGPTSCRVPGQTAAPRAACGSAMASWVAADCGTVGVAATGDKPGGGRPSNTPAPGPVAFAPPPRSADWAGRCNSQYG
jgi:hypothetical protein